MDTIYEEDWHKREFNGGSVKYGNRLLSCFFCASICLTPMRIRFEKCVSNVSQKKNEYISKICKWPVRDDD